MSYILVVILFLNSTTTITTQTLEKDLASCELKSQQLSKQLTTIRHYSTCEKKQ